MMSMGLPEELHLLSRNHRRVVILRNPVNLFRFALHKADVIDEGVAKFLRTWVLYAKEFLGQTERIPQKVSLNYDRWFVDEDYRRELAALLGLEFSDRNLNRLDPKWGGSTYDGFSFQGRAQEMDVLERWRRFQHTRRFQDFVIRLRTHEEAWPLFLTIFGALPAELEEGNTRAEA